MCAGLRTSLTDQAIEPNCPPTEQEARRYALGNRKFFFLSQSFPENATAVENLVTALEDAWRRTTMRILIQHTLARAQLTMLFALDSV